jgi:hypothetical protein
LERNYTKKLGDTLNIKFYEFTIKPEIQRRCILIRIMQFTFSRAASWQLLSRGEAGRYLI